MPLTQPPSSQRAWYLSLGLIALWLALSLGWSWFLIDSSFNQAMAQRLGDRARYLAGSLRDRLGSTATMPRGDRFVSLAADLALPAYLASERARDPHLAYIMLWDTQGRIIAHSQPDLPGTFLDASQWPALDPAQDRRLSELKSLPWAPGPLTEVTVPLKTNPDAGPTLFYVSLGVSQSWIDAQFWKTQRPLLLLVALLAGLGSLLLLAALSLAQRRLRHNQRQLEQNTRARTSLLTERGMLASVLAHEVRSPLTALRFNLYTLRSLLAARADADARRPLDLTDSCEREIRRLDLMLTDFLLRTQVISPPEHTDVNQVVLEALDFLRPTLERHAIRTITHLDPTGPRVSVNPDELRQVLLNLAANAQDAMTQGRAAGGGAKEGTLAVSTLTEPDAVTLLVRDNGPGIPPDIRDRIFEPFFSTKPQGSGLGLALVRRVISGAGGTIFCESTVAKTGAAGTTFRIVLPRALDATANSIPAAEETSEPSELIGP